MVKLGFSGISERITKRFSGVTEKDLIKGIGIVALSGVFVAATSYIMSGRIQLPPEAAAMAGTIRIVSAVTGILGTLIGFAFWTGVYHGLSHLLGGTGDMKRMFALNGYANLPLLAQHALRLIYYALVNDPSDLLPAANAGILQRVLGVFNFWTALSLILTIYAIRENYKLKGWKPILIASIPLLINLALAFFLRSMPVGQMGQLPAGTS